VIGRPAFTRRKPARGDGRARRITPGVRQRPRWLRMGMLGAGALFLIVLAMRLRRRRALRSCGGARAQFQHAGVGCAHVDEPCCGALQAHGTSASACEHEEGPWRELLKRRLLKLPCNSRTLFGVIIAAGVLVVIAAGIIGAGPHLPMATVLVRASSSASQFARISQAALILGVVCSAIAWIIVLAGLFLAHWIVRLVGLVALAGGALAERHDLPLTSIFHATSGVFALFGILLTGLFTVTADLWSWRGTPKLDLRTPSWICLIVSVVALCVAIAYVGQAVRLAPDGSLILGSVFELELLNVTAILVLPMLLLAGADVADVASEIGKGIRESLPLRSTVIVPVVSAGVAVVGIIVAVGALGARIYVNVALAAVLIGLIAALAAVTRPYPDPGWKKSSPALAAVAVLFWFVPAIQIATGVQKVPPPSLAMQAPAITQYVQPSQPIFSLGYPHADEPRVYNLAGPDFSAVRESRRSSIPIGPATMTRSPNDAPQGSAIVDRFAARTGVFWIVLASAGAVLLLCRRRRADPFKQAVLFMVTVGAWIALIVLTRTLAIAGHGLLRLEIGGVQALAGLATLGCVAVYVFGRLASGRQGSGRRAGKQQAILEKIGSLFVLDCSLLLIWGAAILYGKAADIGETLAIVGSVVVVLALTWDFMFSGEMLNEGEADSFMPQRSRILAYLGYLLLTLAVVLLLGTLRSATTGAHIGVIGVEGLVEVGIVAFGVPLAITLFLVCWFRQESPGQSQAATDAMHPQCPLAAMPGAVPSHTPADRADRVPAPDPADRLSS
jgi:hypothetical protein